MKKGSKARKCSQCGQVVLWIIPGKPVLGIQFCTTKTVKPFSVRSGIPGYCCDDCYNKLKHY